MKQRIYLVLGVVAIFCILGSLCVEQSPAKFGQPEQNPGEKICQQDGDCACGSHITTGECFYGNRQYVNTQRQCPDFCSGIAGHLVIKCVDSVCRQVSG